MKWTVYIVMVLVTFAYLIIGAVVFHFMERDDEAEAKRVFAKVHTEFLKNNTCITHEALQKYIIAVMETQSAGVSVSTLIDKLGSSNGTKEDIEDTGTKWDIPSAILFCITVISTIGYGNMSPKTWNGQLFCIFYAVIGIPMFATVLVGTGERLQIPIKKLHKGRPWIKNNAPRDEKLKSIVLLSIGTCLLVFIPSLVFDVTQNWSYVESVYYTVITLTTVGFGDLVPAETQTKKQNVYRVILGLWILLGLSWGALILSEIGSLLTTEITSAANQTQQKLSDLEHIVRKKAKQTRDKIVKKDKLQLNKKSKSLPEAEVGITDRESDDDLKYDPTDSDY
ncbi:hypothetical protein BsWGS_10314 [Bradybaena similaris]